MPINSDRIGAAEKPLRLLVAWFRYTLNGGLGRFRQLSRVLERQGHDVDFLSLSGDKTSDWPGFPANVLTLDEARRRHYDSVHVPGAGAPDDQLALLDRLRSANFGTRVQHLLNSPQRLAAFQVANGHFAPDVVIANNSQWHARDFRSLSAKAFYVVPGAVDSELFHPRRRWRWPFGRCVVGAYAAKNLSTVLDMFALLPPERFELRLFGQIPDEVRSKLARFNRRERRIRDVGLQFDADLARFYHRCDLFVCAESAAGWCNPGAEAAACGLPTVVTPAGTIDFAVHGETALVASRPHAGELASLVLEIAHNPRAARELGRRAAENIRSFHWQAYANRILQCSRPPEASAYYAAPELGIAGKWDRGTRLNGLATLLEKVDGASVLDLGSAEGLVSLSLAEHGAREVDGFDFDALRAARAERLFAEHARARGRFHRADLGNWSRFEKSHAANLKPSYDVVLFLGLYHHLPKEGRGESLRGALERARRWFAFRAPEDVVEAEQIVRRVCDAGFTLRHAQPSDPEEQLGWCGVFERVRAA